MTRQPQVIAELARHPNLAEVVGVLAQLAHIRDDELPQLAAAWTDPPSVREARARALSPDSPLVLEVLASFDAVGTLFADDVLGEAGYLTVPPAQVRTALCAIRDAIAAAYAQPVLSRAAHDALLAPWRAVYTSSTVREPDLGPRTEQVKELLSVLPQLSARCHDDVARTLYDALSDRAFVGESDRAAATEHAFDAAVLTSRRRVWALVRRTGAESLSRPCRDCRRTESPNDPDLRRVRTLCLDAACALLVADALPDDTTRVLTDPVLSLIPQQRDPSS